jgi:hypothetical protein
MLSHRLRDVLRHGTTTLPSTHSTRRTSTIHQHHVIAPTTSRASVFTDERLLRCSVAQEVRCVELPHAPRHSRAPLRMLPRCWLYAKTIRCLPHSSIVGPWPQASGTPWLGFAMDRSRRLLTPHWIVVGTGSDSGRWTVHGRVQGSEAQREEAPSLGRRWRGDRRVCRLVPVSFFL